MPCRAHWPPAPRAGPIADPVGTDSSAGGNRSGIGTGDAVCGVECPAPQLLSDDCRCVCPEVLEPRGGACCDRGSLCDEATSAYPCPGGTSVCQDVCRPNCPDGSRYDAATCECSVGVGSRVRCAGARVDLQTNARHCGACDNACGFGQACASGRCCVANGSFCQADDQCCSRDCDATGVCR